MAPVDYAILLIYFVIVIGVGFFYSRYASRDLKSYFLGGQRLPWLALAMSGFVSTFDITGTMWIVSVIYILGFKSMWHHWMWGFLMAAFFLSYMGKWVRRSNVITAAVIAPFTSPGTAPASKTLPDLSVGWATRCPRGSFLNS